jgi:hypothetical protein
MPESKKKDKAASRREFFRTGLLGAGAAGALAAAKSTGVAAAEVAGDGGAAGYRETEHVKKVYALARF